jgi:hypothetical protein
MSGFRAIANVDYDRIELRVPTYEDRGVVHAISLEDALTLAEALTAACARLAMEREAREEIALK